jgi:hypothetical protein
MMRESYRKEAQRVGLPGSFAFESFVLTVLLSCALGIFWIFYMGTGLVDVLVLFVSVVIEAASEISLYLRLRELDFACKTRADAISQFVRNLSFGFFIFVGFGTTSFGLAQVVNSVVTLMALISPGSIGTLSKDSDRTDVAKVGWKARVSVFLRDLRKSATMPHLRKSSTLQRTAWLAVQKLVISQAENVILLSFFDSKVWGVYGLATNFGALVVRTFFAPIEDIAFATFTADTLAARASPPLKDTPPAAKAAELPQRLREAPSGLRARHRPRAPQRPHVHAPRPVGVVSEGCRGVRARVKHERRHCSQHRAAGR